MFKRNLNLTNIVLVLPFVIGNPRTIVFCNWCGRRRNVQNVSNIVSVRTQSSVAIANGIQPKRTLKENVTVLNRAKRPFDQVGNPNRIGYNYLSNRYGCRAVMTVLKEKRNRRFGFPSFGHNNIHLRIVFLRRPFVINSVF